MKNERSVNKSLQLYSTPLNLTQPSAGIIITPVMTCCDTTCLPCSCLFINLSGAGRFSVAVAAYYSLNEVKQQTELSLLMLSSLQGIKISSFIYKVAEQCWCQCRSVLYCWASIWYIMISVTLKGVQFLPPWLSVVKHISSPFCSVRLQTGLFAPFTDHVRGEN